MQQLLTQIIMVDLAFQEIVHLTRSEPLPLAFNLISTYPYILTHVCLHHSAIWQVLVAYENKVQELESQGLEEDELNKKLELLKVSI